MNFNKTPTINCTHTYMIVDVTIPYSHHEECQCKCFQRHTFNTGRVDSINFKQFGSLYGGMYQCCQSIVRFMYIQPILYDILIVDVVIQIETSSFLVWHFLYKT